MVAAVLILAVLAGVVFGTGILKKNPAVPEPTPSAAPTETAEPTPEMQEPAETPEPEPEPEPEAAPAQEETDTPGDFRTVGSVVTFGAYEQDNDLENGKEPIEWIVLDVQDGKSLLISRYALDYMIYNPDGRVATWETCSLRKWLNSTFVEDAFSSEEQEMIPTVTVITDKNPDHDTNPGRDAQDRVFLLSIQEAEKYFASEEERKCKPSPYAEMLGASVNPETGRPATIASMPHAAAMKALSTLGAAQPGRKIVFAPFYGLTWKLKSVLRRKRQKVTRPGI